MVGSSKGKVDVPSIRAVEFVDDNAFGLPHTFQVQYITVTVTVSYQLT